jgi:alkylation response protein AidB-like acyl-CoA dehydrogenase
VLDAAEAIAAATASEIAAVPDARLAAVPDARLAAVPDARLAAVPDARLAAVPDARLAAEAQLAVAKVKVHLDDVPPEAATRLPELGGASAASRQRNLDRHWRNIRTITLHNPVAHKARVIGQNLLHGTPVPANAYV